LLATRVSGAAQTTLENNTTASTLQRILIVDDNPVFRRTLAQLLRAEGHEVITPGSGVNAFLALRDRSPPVGWLYASVTLPGLVDGWILADAYHEVYRDRIVIFSGSEAQVSLQGDIILKHPTATAAFKVICEGLAGRHRAFSAAARSIDAQQGA
jgi:CheY-like chemotaxis protein